MFRKIRQDEVEFAKKLVQKAFPKLKSINTMRRTGRDVFYLGQFKISLEFPKVYNESYDVSIVKYENRWFYQVVRWRSKDDGWEEVEETIRWIHPETDEIYDDRQIVIDEYKTLPYLSKLKNTILCNNDMRG